MHLTIKPGIVFSAATVSFLRTVGFTDDDVAADLAEFERTDVPLWVARNFRDAGYPVAYVVDLMRATIGATTFAGAL
jgi:hypothetical protein